MPRDRFVFWLLGAHLSLSGSSWTALGQVDVLHRLIGLRLPPQACHTLRWNIDLVLKDVISAGRVIYNLRSIDTGQFRDVHGSLVRWSSDGLRELLRICCTFSGKKLVEPIALRDIAALTVSCHFLCLSTCVNRLHFTPPDLSFGFRPGLFPTVKNTLNDSGLKSKGLKFQKIQLLINDPVELTLRIQANYNFYRIAVPNKLL